MIRIQFPSASSYDGRRPPDDPERPTVDGGSPDVAVIPAVPEAALVRHGARILRPSEAVVLAGQAPLRPTVYLQNSLLMPPDVTDDTRLNQLSGFLKDLKVYLVPPIGLDEVLGDGYGSRVDDPAFRDLPRPVGIEPIPGSATMVDAWTVLQTLRAAADEAAIAAEEAKKTADEATARVAAERADLLRSTVDGISLEHLMVGSALDGAGGVLFEGMGNTASHGSPDLGGLFDRPTPGTSGRIPVTVALAELPRPPAQGARRAVVAVLDTGVVENHPWLPVTRWDPVAGNPADLTDAVVIVDPAAQEAIRKAAFDANGTPTRLPIVGFEDRPPIGEPLLGELSTHTGHGTFIAGLIRQIAPAARVYALRVMHPDGFAHEADVLVALALLESHVRDGTLPVDVVSLSLGYFHESDAEQQVTDRLKPRLDALAELGVTVVAAAGNFSTSREFYPAALAVPSRPATEAPTISVGALNPNGSRARFSNEAPWVTCFASGVAMVSTFPPVRGELAPLARGTLREAFDPDDFTSGYAMWTGTSFAAPSVAATIVTRLGALPEREPAGAEAANRAFAALHPHKQPLTAPVLEEQSADARPEASAVTS